MDDRLTRVESAIVELQHSIAGVEPRLAAVERAIGVNSLADAATVVEPVPPARP